MVRRPNPSSVYGCADGVRGYCYCWRVLDDILENPYYKNPNKPGAPDMAGPFGPGGVGGASGDAARWGYMAWESLKLKNGTNSTNANYSRPPAPMALLQTSASNSGPAPRYGLLTLTLGATLSGLLLPSWGTLLIILLALLPQANAQGGQVWPPPSPLYLLDSNKVDISPQPQNF
jgi:hypothetical protein